MILASFLENGINITYKIPNIVQSSVSLSSIYVYIYIYILFLGVFTSNPNSIFTIYFLSDRIYFIMRALENGIVSHLNIQDSFEKSPR